MSNPTSPERAPSWLRLGLIAVTVICIDQVTKFLAVKRLTYAFERARAHTLGEQIHAFLTARHLSDELRPPFFTQVIPHFWSNRYAENPGAAWSMLASAPESVRDPFFRIVSIVALCLIAFYYSRLRPGQGLLGVALSLVMGGAIGNLIDRFVRSYVIDFIDWHVNDAEWRKLWDWPSIEWTNHGLGFTWVKMHPHWPTFNIADTGISVGVALIALDTLLVWWAQRRTDHSEPLSAGT